MIHFVFDGKKYITVSAEGLPSTIIKCESTLNDDVLKTCQEWLDALKLTDIEYHVDVRLH